MLVGLIIVSLAAAIWLLAPEQVDSLLNRDGAPLLVTVAPDQAYAGNEVALLPETPLDSLQYPSFASVEEAGKNPPPPQPGQPVRLSIPAIGVDAPITEVGLNRVNIQGRDVFQWGVPAGYAGGWHNDSARLGEVGNTVINGHNNILGEVFKDLSQLKVGDQFTLFDTVEGHLYQIQQIETLAEQDQPIHVRLDNARWIEPTGDERVTLVTCWPYETNSHRLIVVAVPANQ